ncbi:type II toxin-antitoxin system PrlF family antitoxin (plasmid) [Rossellomorea sp. AcN35-11]|nr:type II toxin-antitoxin system PrlF family antitoxin [Rossellomorea aquimaris]WJV32049.1 type II toxin-antitoxin system PrlF family antitoxin [Rossellomorea sp. AcN35-11]
MIKSKSTLTTKGQITLPKTIRDILELQTGDDVSFSVNPGEKRVIMEKDNDEDNIRVFNLVDVFSKTSPIVVTGRVASGKTRFVKTWIRNYKSMGKVGISDPSGEYKDIFNSGDRFININFDEFDDPQSFIEYLDDEEIDCLIVDEVQRARVDLVEAANKTEREMVLVGQLIKRDLMSKIGDFILVEMEGTSELSIDQYKSNDLNYRTYSLLKGKFDLGFMSGKSDE